MNKNLVKLIKKYSIIKTVLVMPCLIMAMISTVLLMILVTLNLFLPVAEVLIFIFGSIMIGTIIFPLIVILLSEKLRNNIVNYDILSFIDMMANEPKFNKLSYYEFLDLFRSTVRIKYISSLSNERTEDDLINAFHYIFFSDKDIWTYLNNYDNRKEFFKLCKFIKKETKSDKAYINIVNDIKKLLDISNKEYNIRNKLNPTKNLFKKIKIMLLFICILTYFNPEFNSWVFNLIAIILISIDIIRDNNGDSTI